MSDGITSAIIFFNRVDERARIHHHYGKIVIYFKLAGSYIENIFLVSSELGKW